MWNIFAGIFCRVQQVMAPMSREESVSNSPLVGGGCAEATEGWHPCPDFNCRVYRNYSSLKSAWLQNVGKYKYRKMKEETHSSTGTKMTKLMESMSRQHIGESEKQRTQNNQLKWEGTAVDLSLPRGIRQTVCPWNPESRLNLKVLSLNVHYIFPCR